MYEKKTKILSVLAAMFFVLFFGEYANTFQKTAIHTQEKTVCASYLDDRNKKAEYCITIIEGKPENVTSKARVIEEETLIHQRIPAITKEDLEILCRIVQAEAGGEDQLGKQMVADVIINRVSSSKFPNSISGVVFQKNGELSQFSPVDDGRYYAVSVSEETREAVNTALCGTDKTGGALYFVAAQKAAPDRLAWFQSSLHFVMEHGGHQFYK